MTFQVLYHKWYSMIRQYEYLYENTYNIYVWRKEQPQNVVYSINFKRWKNAERYCHRDGIHDGIYLLVNKFTTGLKNGGIRKKDLSIV